MNYLDMEVQNGGLCQYFVNSSRYTAPYIKECLDLIKADSYSKLFYDFVTKHKIDVNNLESFIVEEIEEYEAQTELYPFDDFDDAYYKLYKKEPLEKILITYARQHLEDFF